MRSSFPGVSRAFYVPRWGGYLLTLLANEITAFSHAAVSNGARSRIICSLGESTCTHPIHA